MKNFMDKDFLLETETAKTLYHDYAEKMPIFDYHCHLIPEQIAKNVRFTTITDAWLGGDHYKWRQIRTCGFPEERITGNADAWSKFTAWAETMENLIGNPLYHWTHLELQRYFGINDVLNRKNAKKIYEEANKKFSEDPDLTVWGIMKKFNVYAVGTTDDPADDLKWHKVIRDALEKRLDFFVEMGCKASDHALMTCPSTFWSEEDVDRVFKNKIGGQEPTAVEADAYRTFVLSKLAKMYNKKNIAMQLHFASIRDNNKALYNKLGPDTGFDASYDAELAMGVSKFMGALSETNEIPKTIFYSLNPKDYYSLGTLMGCWQGEGVKGKIQLGSAWWFCDHRDGMEEQLKVLANLGSLPSFIGMLTDSRSFLSYSRHEYFRRILCNVIGNWVENGEVPLDMEWLGSIVENISFNNAKHYFED